MRRRYLTGPLAHVGGGAEALEEDHEGERVPAARAAAPVVVGPGRDPDRLPPFLAEPVQLGQEARHRPVCGLLPPLVRVLADGVLPHAPEFSRPRPPECSGGRSRRRMTEPQLGCQPWTTRSSCRTGRAGSWPPS